MVGTLRLDDPERRYAAVRLCSDLHLPIARLPARRRRLGAAAPADSARPARVPARARRPRRGDRDRVRPRQPQRAPGAFGEKSVLAAPGYRPPAWLDEPGVPATVGGLSVRVLGARRWRSRVWSPGEGELPLLVAHDGPEYAELAGADAATPRAMIARGRAAAVPRRAAAARRPQRVVFGVGRVRRARCARGSCRRCATQLGVAGRPVGMGASLGGAGDAPGAAHLAGHVRRAVPAVGQLLRPAL